MRRLWTVQPLEVLEQVERDGVALVDPARAGPSRPRAAAEFHTPEAYVWLTRQLQGRQPGWAGRLPWWCYPEKPDLRLHRWHQKGPQVRLELLVPDTRVAEFPLWAWDLVFREEVLLRTERQQREWWRRAGGSRREGSWPPALRRRVEATWEALFDPDLPPRVRFGPFRGSRERVAVLEEIRPEDLRRVTRFAGRCRWP